MGNKKTKISFFELTKKEIESISKAIRKDRSPGDCSLLGDTLYQKISHSAMGGNPYIKCKDTGITVDIIYPDNISGKKRDADLFILALTSEELSFFKELPPRKDAVIATSNQQDNPIYCVSECGGHSFMGHGFRFFINVSVPVK